MLQAAGEAALAGLGGAAVRLNFVPLFQKFDKVPAPDQMSSKMEKMIKFFGSQLTDKQTFECRLQ